MLPTMRFMIFTIMWMTFHSTREGLLARIFSWIPGILPYRYSIAGLLSSRDLNEWIRYAKRFNTGMRRWFSLIQKWICASRRAQAPFWIFFFQVMHFYILRLVNSMSTSPYSDLINYTPFLKVPYNICARHSMVNRGLGGEKWSHWCSLTPVHP